MYLHLGNDTVINTDNIVGIFDLESSSVSRHTKKYLAKIQKDKKVINVSMELPKSLIVCRESNERPNNEACQIGEARDEVVYISQISVSTLLKRLNNHNKLDIRK